MVMLLRDCIARPDTDNQRFGLIEHLIAVAERCGRVDREPELKLAFLAGLLHDAAKAAFAWQEYIRGKLKKGPSHAPQGAALFAFWVDDLIPRWTTDNQSRKHLYDLALDWTRIIYDHHGGIQNLALDEPPWANLPGDLTPDTLLNTCDQAGLSNFVQLFFPETEAKLSSFPSWLEGFYDTWRIRIGRDRNRIIKQTIKANSQDKVPAVEKGLRLPELGAKLIFADRSHAADWDVEYLGNDQVDQAIIKLNEFCSQRALSALAQNSSPIIVQRRTEIRDEALRNYQIAHENQFLFTLLLPTGYGKTLAGIRIALESCRKSSSTKPNPKVPKVPQADNKKGKEDSNTQRRKRIIYVAPYLSILSQAAAEIHAATKLEVFVHHHMSVVTMEEDHQSYDLLETWQTPILATTFNQLCRALFPARAQQCLRIPALEDAFIMIDEPQIIDPMVWNLFLKALSVIARKYRTQILFVTATMPPTEYALGMEIPFPLVSKETSATILQSRYTITTIPTIWKPKATAEALKAKLEVKKSVVGILNTVKDAVDVYNEVRSIDSNKQWICLTARMLPGHRIKLLQIIRDRLGRNAPTGVVATQLIEAGVDLSFQSVLRAVPIFSSIIQASGRANRHGEGESAEVVVFHFRRENDDDSRKWVYGNNAATKITDSILEANPIFDEREVPKILDNYFKRMWEADSKTGSLEQLERSARGEWEALAGLQPFADEMQQLAIFIPGSDHYLTDEMRLIMASLQVRDSRHLLEVMEDRKFCRSLGFIGRKRFSGFIRQFCVSVPKNIAEKIATQSEKIKWLWVLDPSIVYSSETGLAMISPDQSDDGILIC